MRGLTLPAIHKHIKLLEKGDLILRKKIGRTNVLTLNRESMRCLQDWIAQYHVYWGSDDASLQNYAQYVSKNNQSKNEKGAKMKKFLILSNGFVPPTPEIMEAWGKWFTSIGDKLVEPGNPLGAGREITLKGTKELPVDLQATTGYMIISAKDMDEAVKIAKAAPIITNMRVYELMSMGGGH